MNIFPRTSLASSLLAMLGLVLGLRKSRVWFMLSALAGFLLLLHMHHDRHGQTVHRRLGARKTDEAEVPTAILSQIRDKYADNSEWRTRHIKEDPGI